MLFLFSDCSVISVDGDVSNSVESVTITYSTSQLTPAHQGANMAFLYIWSTTDFRLSLSDDTLSRVRGWRDNEMCDKEEFVYQTARVLATAEFTSGSDSFTANVVDIIIDTVSLTLIHSGTPL